LKTLFHSKNIFGAIIAKGGTFSQFLSSTLGRRSCAGEDEEEEVEKEEEIEE